jgi:hypothetical protein
VERYLLDPDANPYLDLWNWFLEVVRGMHGTPLEWWAVWTADPTARTNLLLIPTLVFILYIRMGGGWGRHRGTERRDRLADREERVVKRKDNTPRLKRWWWYWFPPSDRMKIDGLELARSGKTSHWMWVGPTGSGKSAGVATTRINGQRPTLIVIPDYADAIIAQVQAVGGMRWTACHAANKIDFLRGSPAELAEKLTDVFRSGGVGAWKLAVRRRATKVIRDMDDEGEPRTLYGIGERLRVEVAKDKNLALICAGWVDRFCDLAERLGDSIGEGGIDLLDVLRDGATVLLDNDAFNHPSLGADIVALGLAEAKRIARHMPHGFRLIFDEAAQLGDRIDLADPFFRAGRRRKIAVDAISQGESDFDKAPGIGINTAGRVYFATEDEQLRKAAARRLGIDQTELDPGVMKDYTAWIAAGRIRRLVKFPKPLEPKGSVDPFDVWVEDQAEADTIEAETVGRTGPTGPVGPDYPTGGDDSARREPGAIYTIREVEPDRGAGTDETGSDEEWALPRRVNGAFLLPGANVVVPVWISESERRREIWDKLSGTWNEQGDHLWTKGKNKGYGKTWYLNVGGWSTHFLFWAWKVMDDHERGVPGDLERFYRVNSDVPRFTWPALADELVTLRALKKWMKQPDPERGNLSLSIDHCCPGFPNTLCGNWRHHQLVADEPGREGSNSKLRHERRSGAGRLKAEGSVG